ncbi:kinase-like protein [Yamadazyma tenuis ATCC 10573]|uniref:Kinase-like protein n=2 Tax=Candida tenuis TaxID=2315449 RepID=G3BEZ4_CANTC|nr:kinase-like protein [Yamadazyma tenuis ATCC 10573]EGV59971.1 kinase-like protein [Yamadazyma tenuis ATCC 10573]
MRKNSNPFNSPNSPASSFPDSYPLITSRRHLSNSSRPSDITNLNYERSRKDSPSKRHISQSAAEISKADVYTRLYNGSKPKPSLHHDGTHHQPSQQSPSNALRRSFSSLELQKEIPKIRSLSHLYATIYDEDPSLFEDVESTEFCSNESKTVEELTIEGSSETETSLDVYERGELLRRKDIYILPDIHSQGHRSINIRNHSNNYGFDDKTGNYVVIPNDHIKYRYRILSVLGNGSFGNVVKCLDKKYTDPKNHKDKVVAIKIIKSDINWSLQAVYEIKMLKHLNSHKTVVEGNTYASEYATSDCPVLKYYDHFHFRGHMCIVMEPLSVNLFTMLEIIKFQGLSLPVLQLFVKKILRGLEYIHSMNILHCDIKPENIMIKFPSAASLDDVTEESLVVKIVDFGTSCFVNEISYSYIQSRFYRAPEVILGARYDKMIDIWSLGCIVTELFTGDALLPGKNELEQIALILELFGAPNSGLILQQRHSLLRSMKEQTAVNKFDERASVNNSNILNSGGADEKSIKKTLLYTFFDMEGRINIQFLNMRIQAAQNIAGGTTNGRKTFKIASRNLEMRLRLRSCREDSKKSESFIKFLSKIFKWDPNQRTDASGLLQDPFLTDSD